MAAVWIEVQVGEAVSWVAWGDLGGLAVRDHG